MSQEKPQKDRNNNPRKVADHAFLRIHYEISETMDVIDEITEALSQALAKRNSQRASRATNNYYPCYVRRRNARNEIADRLKSLQILAGDDPPLPHTA